MQTNTTKKQWFSKLLKAMILWKKKQPLKIVNPTFELYLSCNKLPIENFITCVVDGNLSALVISGLPPEEKIREAWSFIYEEYIDLIGDNEYLLYLRTVKDFTLIQSKYSIIINSINCLEKVFNERLAKKVLIELGGNFKFNYHNPEEYQKDIEGLRNRTKTLKIQLDIKRIELEQAESIRPKDKADRNYYTQLFIHLSTFYKFHITSDITVAEFCLRLKNVLQSK